MERRTTRILTRPRRKIRAIITVIAVAALSVVAAAPAQAAVVSGTWAGPVVQPGSEDYRVRVTIEDTLVLGEVVATVTYPGLGCSGEWTYLGRNARGRFLFEEHITAQTNCVEEVLIKLKRDGQTIKYVALWDNDRATATLRRRAA